MLTCRQATDLVTSHLEQAMGIWQKIQFRFHLLICPSCRIHLSKMRKLIHALVHVSGHTDVPDKFIERLVSPKNPK